MREFKLTARQAVQQFGDDVSQEINWKNKRNSRKLLNFNIYRFGTFTLLAIQQENLTVCP